MIEPQNPDGKAQSDQPVREAHEVNFDQGRAGMREALERAAGRAAAEPVSSRHPFQPPETGDEEGPEAHFDQGRADMRDALEREPVGVREYDLAARFKNLPEDQQDGFRQMAETNDPSDIAQAAAQEGLSREQVGDILHSLYPTGDPQVIKAALDKAQYKDAPAQEPTGYEGQDREDLQELVPQAQEAMRNPGKENKNIYAFMAKFQERFGEMGGDVLMKVLKTASIGIGIFILLVMMIAIIHSPKSRG